MIPDTTERSVLIGVSGHRDLRPEDLTRIQQELLSKIKELTTQCNSPVLIAGTAAGTDTIVMQLAKTESLPFLDLNAVVPREQQESDDNYYARQADYLLAHCTHIVVAWDGIYTHKPGGTSEIVRGALYGERPITIHHLVTPRVSNPFPIASLLEEVIDYKKKKFLRIPFAIHFSWIILENKGIPRHKVHVLNSNNGEFTWNYLLPVLFIALTLVLGVTGFGLHDNWADTWLNYIFKSINLVTFNESVFKETPNWLMNAARISGLLAVSLTFIYAFRLAFKPQYESLKRRRWKKSGFNLVTGLNEMSFDLIKDLSFHKERTVLLHADENDTFGPDLEKMKNVVVVKGSPSSATMLKAVHFGSAKKVFVMSGDDTQNVRTMQELDILTTPGPDPETPDRFVHIRDEHLRKFLRNNLSRYSINRSNLFNIYENTVRKLLLLYPADRFYQTPEATAAVVFIIGFSELGKQIARTFLKQGHYEPDKRLRINVICENAEVERQQFEKNYPMFFTREHDALQLKKMKAYVWQNIELKFTELPSGSSGWSSGSFPLFPSVTEGNIVTVYACLPNGIGSAAILNNTLPALDLLKQKNNCNLQVFCYYNFPDKKEELVIEDHLNKLAPHTFVKCFGNFKDECSSAAIQNMALDALPQLIHAKYSNPWIFELQDKVETHWYQASEKDKSSSRQAGDHLWTKLRILGPLIAWQFEPSSFEPKAAMRDKLYNNEVIAKMGEIEHRRWCAEMMLQGFVPPEEAPDSPAYITLAEKWTDKAFKQETLHLGMHINLVPYDNLLEREAAKDTDQIKTIPVFLQRIIHT